MKVCVIGHTVLESDARVRREAECLADRGDIVDVLCLRNGNEKRMETTGTIQIYRITNCRKPSSAPAILAQLSLFFLLSFLCTSYLHLRKRYDVVHVHSIPDFEVFAAIIPKLLGARIILDMHETMPELYMRKFGLGQDSWMIKIIQFVETAAVKFADHVIVATPYFRNKIIRQGARPDKCTTILNIPDLTRFGKSAGAYSRAPNKFRLVYPGTLSEFHGVDIAIRAVGVVSHEYCVPVELHIYGRGPAQQALISLARSLNLEDRIIFHSPVAVEDLASILHEMDAGVVPKRTGVYADEAISTKLFEFAASNLPAIVSRTTGDSLYFDDSMVLYFEPGNEHDLADCIIKLYRDPNHGRSLAENARRVFDKTNWNTMKEAFCVILNSQNE